MTREEMLDGLYDIKNWKCDSDAEMHEVVTETIKALEQEPCEDCISRKAYIERFRKWAYSEFGQKMDDGALAIRVAMSLPSVTPQQKGRVEVLDKIRAEIESHIIDSNGLDFNSALCIAIEIIDKCKTESDE